MKSLTFAVFMIWAICTVNASCAAGEFMNNGLCDICYFGCKLCSSEWVCIGCAENSFRDMKYDCAYLFLL